MTRAAFTPAELRAAALTPIGCGLAGYKRADIWAILHRVKLPYNVHLTPEWVNDHA